MATELRRIKVDLGNIFEGPVKTSPPSKTDFFYIPHKQLKAWEEQPRHKFDQVKLNELAESIKATGIIQPIIVRKNPLSEDGKYEIIAGERRWRAAQIAGLEEVPVVVRDIPDEKALISALTENVQREDLNPIEQAIAVDRMHREFNLSHNEIAPIIGKSRPVVWSLMKLLTLPDEIKTYLEENKIDMGHVKALFSLSGDDLILCARKIVKEGLSVRQAEELSQKIKAGIVADNDQDQKKYAEEISVCNKSIAEWNKVLSDRFSSSVHINLNKKGEGRVIFQVDSVEELGWLVNAFTKI